MKANNRGNPEIHTDGMWDEGAERHPEPTTDSRTGRPDPDAPPLVSVSMITYKHEPYVEEAIRGVLMQETSFAIELIVSNDHSPDKTHHVIQSLLLHHPRAGRVRYIRHNRNLGIMGNALHNLNHCRGTYIAFCEGDDCWTDTKKLQKQVEQLEKNPSVDLCFHPAQTFFGRQNTNQLFGFQSCRQKRIRTDAVISGGGDFCPTASILIRRDVFEKLAEFLRTTPVGDYFLQVMGSMRGGAIYLPDPMCVYRRGTPFSWTTDMQSIRRRKDFFELIFESLKRFDEFLGHAKSGPLNLEIERQYLHLSLTYISHGMLADYRALYETFKRRHSISTRVKILYKVGLRSRSERLTREFDRWIFARPNPFSRAIRSFAKAVYQIRSASPTPRHKPPNRTLTSRSIQ
jgi:glycosyltransferase involved in cell wall biosynthesis